MKNDVRLGSLIDDDATKDAVHVAIAPVMAAANLVAGDHIGFVPESREYVQKTDKTIGIVDPFLERTLTAGDRFWMFLYPNTITLLKHVWTHPDFPIPETTVVSKITREDSEVYLREFADKARLHYDRMIEILSDYIDDGEIWVEYGTENARDTFYSLIDKSEFWEHVKNVTGKSRDISNDDTPFSCSC